MNRLPARVARTLAVAAGIAGLAVVVFAVWRRDRSAPPDIAVPARAGAVARPLTVARELPPRDDGPAAAKHWATLVRQPPTIARDGELAYMLAQLAETDPEAAERLLLALTETDRRRVVAAVLLDASRDQGLALRLADAFCRLDPTGAIEHGYSLVGVLTRVGEFAAAVEFVRGQAGRRGETENPVKWLGAIFARWATRDGVAAVAAAMAMPPGGMRDEAVDAAIGTWVKVDPQALAVWTTRREAGPEFDRGAAALARDLTPLQPEVALRWAALIGAPGLRSLTIGSILREWKAVDPAAAGLFMRSSTAALPPEDRAALETEIGETAADRPVTNSVPASPSP
jgi:hypothetical protein